MVYNSMALGIGVGYHKALSIPQGCPFSMCFVALLLRPWIMKMRSMPNTKPRILADDLLLIQEGGAKHYDDFCDAFDQTQEYLLDLGSNNSAKKSFLFSTDPNMRQLLKHKNWDALGTTLKVELNFRDLGGHLNSTNAINAITLTNRLIGAIQGIERLTRTPLSYETKQHIIRASSLHFGLYGCEASHANETFLGKLAASISKATGANSTLVAQTIRLNLGGFKNNTDPDLHIWVRRVVMVRRMWFIDPDLQQTIQTILDTYVEHGYVGTHYDKLNELLVAPSPGTASSTAHTCWASPLLRTS